MPKKYRIKLSSEERSDLNELINSNRKIAALKLLKARAILLADEGDEGEAFTDLKIVEVLGIKPITLVRLRERVCEVGPLEALERKKQEKPSRSKVLDGEAEARLVQIACSEAPEGYSRWTLRLLAERLVELEIVGGVSHEAVRQTLKKMKLNLG